MGFKLPDFAAVGFDDPRAVGGLPNFPKDDPGAAGLALFGKGVKDAGVAAIDIAADRQNKQNQVNSALASAVLESNVDRTSEALKHERDPAKIDELKGRLPGFLDSAGAAITDPEARQMWALKHRSKIDKAEAVADGQHRKVYNDRFLAGARQQLDEQSRLAAQSSDPATREQAQRNIGDILGSLENAGIIGAADGQKLGRDYGQNVIIGTVNWLAANKDPIGSGRYLRENLRHIDPDKAESLSRHLRPLEDREIVKRWRSGGPGSVPGGDAGERVAARLKARGWSDAAIVGALNNSITESSLNPDAKGAAGEEGLFQFHPSSHITPFRQQYKGDRSPEAQTDYMADVVEKTMPGYAQSTDSRAATGQFLRGFEKPKDQSDAALAARAANETASRTILGRAGAPAAATTPSASRPFDSVIGDSIAVGVMGAAKLPGDAQDGRTTQQVLDAIVATDPVLMKDRRIFLSSGASNSPDALDLVPQQLAALKKAGADVVLSGVGSGVANYRAVNAKLAEHAKTAGVPFTGEIPGTQGGRVHPRDYGPLAKQAAGVAQGAPPLAPGVPDIRTEAARIKAAKERGELTDEQADIAYREAQQDQQQIMLGHARAESDLTLAVARGEKGSADIEDAYAQQRITPETRTRLQAHLIEEGKKQAARDQMILRAISAGAGGDPLDPKSKDDRAGANLLYDAVSKTWMAELQAKRAIDPEAVDDTLDRQIGFSQKYGMVPTALQARIRGGLHSGRPELQVEAARTVGRLKNANPQLVGELGDENDLRLATAISERVSAGVPAERAVQMTVEGMKVTKAVTEARGDEFKTLRGTDDVKRQAADTAWLHKQNDTWGRDPTVPAQMRQEFDDTTKAEFQLIGNLEAARQMALGSINTVWGRTRVGGEFRYMKYAPEVAYAVPNMTAEQNAKWQNEQLVIDAGKARPIGAAPIPADKLRVLEYPGKTGPNGRPLYQVHVVDDKGVWDVLRKTGGAPIEWYPDFPRALEFKRQQDATQAGIERARQLRREELERRTIIDPGQP